MNPKIQWLAQTKKNMVETEFKHGPPEVREWRQARVPLCPAALLRPAPDYAKESRPRGLIPSSIK
ncbi:unnamed protein product [Ilex paraguariensis]|uniref:Uncharacterized protein n=1 Tax=Ilex paraguariensis TaxID=185542 RepID=A0ABC8U3V5_9AQUA